MGMYRIAVVVGSLRKDSFNRKLATALARLAPADFAFQQVRIDDLPLYNQDDDGAPAEAVRRFKAEIAGAQGVLFVTPEYNRSIPGVLKNAIDWLSRPADEIPRVFGGRPFALAGASPGGFGTVLSQAHWLPVLKTLGVDLWAGGRLLASRSGSLFDAGGALVDDKLRTQLAAFVQGFAGYVAGKRG